jgi:hypothetical protein
MAEGKKTFVFYSDWVNMIREMPDKDAGELLKHILSYVNDEEPSTDNLLVKMAFGHIMPMLKADLQKWDKQLKNYSDMGKKSAASRGKKKVEPTLTKVKPTSTVNVNVNDNVNVNVNDNKDKEAVFKKTLLTFQDNYDVELLKEFFYYWTEKSDNGKKMRFELSKNQPFNTARRLGTWKKNQNKFGTPKTTTESRQEMNRALFNEAIKN